MKESDATTRAAVVSNSVVLAPMVRGSELAFRMLMRARGGISECYSPMMRSEHVVAAYNKYNTNEDLDDLHEDARLFLFDSCAQDNPLVVQLCGSCPNTLYEATRAVVLHYQKVHSNPVHGIDLNLGCPQSCAQVAGFGAFLIENDSQRALQCVTAMKKAIVDTHSGPSSSSRPRLSCKIRLLDTLAETIDLALELQDAGCDLLTVHCRKRVTKHDGAPDLEAGRALSERLSIPVRINGAFIDTPEDVKMTLATTGTSAIMIARAFLSNHRLLRLGDNKVEDPAFLAAEYLEYAKQYPPPSERFLKLHFRYIFRRDCKPRERSAAQYSDNWRHAFWTFLARPYLKTLEQFRHIVVLYVSLRGGELPPSLQDVHPVPTYSSIRHGCKYQEEEEDDDDQGDFTLGSLFQ